MMKQTPLKRGTSQMKRTPLKKVSAKKVKKVKRPISKVKAKLWEECKRIIRAKHGNTCYSCGKGGLEGSNWHTGHFISSSICSVHLRYHLDNLRPQCYNCNINKSGNWIGFEEHLIRDGFDPAVLKALNEKTKNESYRLDWYEAKLEEYRKL